MHDTGDGFHVYDVSVVEPGEDAVAAKVRMAEGLASINANIAASLQIFGGAIEFVFVPWDDSVGAQLPEVHVEVIALPGPSPPPPSPPPPAPPPPTPDRS